MSKLTEFLKREINQIESASKPKKEEFILILGLLESLYAKFYEEQYFVQMNIDRMAKATTATDLLYLNSQVLSQYYRQVNEIISMSDLTIENQTKTLALLRQALQSLEESINAVSREI